MSMKKVKEEIQWSFWSPNNTGKGIRTANLLLFWSHSFVRKTETKELWFQLV